MADEEKRPDADSTAPESAASDNSAPPTGADEPAVEGAPVNEEGATDAVAAAGEPADEKSAGSEAEEGAKAASEPPAPSKSAAAESVAAAVAMPAVDSHGHDGHGHDGHGHDGHGHDGHDHGLGHVMPKSMLLGVLGALIVLTVLTVGVTMVDLGSTGNFIVAMAIATVKAVLVMGFFMHLVWDSRFNALIFLSSFFFVILFLMVSLLDRQEYQPSIDEFARDQAATAPQ